jgi:16S rRNA (cytosine1402-N4)-methyltransferase
MEPTPLIRETRAIHVPVLLREVLSQLKLEPGLVVVDGTVGAGGHSREMLNLIGPQGRLIGLDRDPMMLGHAAQHICGE